MNIRILTTVLMAVSVVTSAFAQPQVNGAAQLVQQGDMALKLGDWDKAIIHFTNAVSIDPQNADAYMKRAKVLAKLGRNNESLDDYNRAIAINPNSALFYDLRAKMKIIALDFPGAETDMTKALSVAPKDPNIQESVMDNYLQMGNYRSALLLADSILTHWGEFDHYIHLKRALTLVFTDEAAAALAEVDHAISEDPGSALAYDLKGVILLKINKPAEAVEAFNEAIQRSPGFDIAYYNRALAYRILGREADAEADFTHAMELATDKAHVAFARAQSRKSLGDAKGAMEDLDMAIDIDPQLKEALFHRSFMKKMLGDKLGALSDADLALSAGKKSPELWNHRANLHLLFGDYNKAIEDYTMAIFLKDDYAIGHYNRGLAHLMNGQNAAGCQDLRKAADLGYARAGEMIASFCQQY